MFPRGTSYEYSGSHLIVMKLNNGENFDEGVTYIKGAHGLNRDNNIVLDDLSEGTYAIFAEIEWVERKKKKNKYKVFPYSISRYGVGGSPMEDITGTIEKTAVLEAAFKSACEQGIGEVTSRTLESDGAPNITVYEGEDESYYFYQYAVNNEASAGYQYTGKYTDCVGVTLQEPYFGSENYVLKADAGESAMMIMKKTISKFSYGKSYSEKVILGAGALI